MGFYSGGRSIGRIFASEIWEGLIFGRAYFFFFGGGGEGGGGIFPRVTTAKDFSGTSGFLIGPILLHT